MIDFLSFIPLWLLAILLNVWLIGFGLAGLWVVRRKVLPLMRLRYNDAYFGAAVVQSSMLLYGLVAALTAVGVWQRYTQASDVVSSEAMAIATLWRDLGGLPQPQRGQLQDVLRGYTEQIIREAWPQQRWGKVPQQGVEWMDRLQAQLFAFEPKTESQKIIHAETLHAYNYLVQQRRQRLDYVNAHLPVVMWYVLLPGAMACIVLCLFCRVEDARLDSILITGLAGFLAMVLFVIISLDRPLCGPMAISADSYQLVYDHQMRN
jgi:hypothetical protein